MPPKKKASKKGSSNTKDVALESGDLLIKANLEIDAVTRELAIKNDIIVRLKSQIQQQTIRIQGLEERFTKKNTDQMDLTSDMSRQYKSMQSELLTKARQLETHNIFLTREIERLEIEKKESTEEFEKIIASKDMIIEDQASKILYISKEFENMLAQTLSKMTKKLEIASSKWKENDKTQLSEVSLKRIKDFHLTRLKLVEGAVSEAA